MLNSGSWFRMAGVTLLSGDVRNTVFVIGGGVVVVGIGVYCWVQKRKRYQLRQKAINKRNLEQSYIAEKLNQLQKEHDGERVKLILQLNSSELLQRLKDGKLLPDEVLKAYLYKACKVTNSLNCVTEIVRGCEKAAKELKTRGSTGQPLYGLPVSIKECMQTKGTASTGGIAKLLDSIAAEDCVLVKVLKECGAIPFVKTNLPQLILSMESSNPIFGETSNPHNPNFGPGGSSSGESSLIGAGASILGFGTDIGGSIRVPCHLCGICGLKPTKYRLSQAGMQGSMPGQTVVSSASGPMARDVDTLVLAMRAILCDTMFKLDPLVVPIKFRDEMYTSKRPMRIAYYLDDGYSKPVPACQRAVKITKEALEQAGHTLVPIEMPDIEWLMERSVEVIFADGGRGNMERLKYDIVNNTIQSYWRKWSMSSPMRKLQAAWLRRQSSRLATDLMGHREKSAYDLWQAAIQVDAYKTKFWTDWREKCLDAMICPVLPVPACPKDTLVESSAWVSYTRTYAILNCPAGVVSVSKVTQKDIDDLKDYKGHYGDRWDHIYKKASAGSLGMPVGVQCISYPWTEEVCLRLMKEVENLLVK